jgi:uncharacterized protein YegJ (DUF2314 family)
MKSARCRVFSILISVSVLALTSACATQGPSSPSGEDVAAVKTPAAEAADTSPDARNTQSSAQDRSDTVLFATDDPEIAAATQEARERVPFFLEHLRNPEEDEYGFSVALSLPADGGPEGNVETLWFTDLRRSGAAWTGLLIDQPYEIASLSAGDRFEFDMDAIVDWRFVKAGTMVGGYMIRAILERISPAQQLQLLSGLPFEIEGFPEVADSPDIATLSRQWRSLRWDYSVTFPLSWSIPQSDDASVQSKDVIEVYCDGPYGASVALFANPITDFRSNLSTAMEMYRELVLNQIDPQAEFVEIPLTEIVRGDDAAAFRYLAGAYMRAFYVLFHEETALTLSVISPQQYWSQIKPDVDAILASIAFD